ncbi:unnamed protein product [Rotaria sp. Silwood1]|nr:unnamed protein product [Rotaria sp. Silwood1]
MFHRTIYLTIRSSISAQECVHKLLKLNLCSGQDIFRRIHLNEEETTSSSCVYIKNLFLELVKFLGLTKLNHRLINPLFPRNNLKNTRFSINFFKSIGLDELTNELRDLLKIHSTTGTYSQTKQQGKKQIENT